MFAINWDEEEVDYGEAAVDEEERVTEDMVYKDPALVAAVCSRDTRPIVDSGSVISTCCPSDFPNIGWEAPSKSVRVESV